MAIQTLRLGSRVSMGVSVNPSFMDILVPRLSLQPFVENVIDHALAERPVHVEIAARADGGDLRITIADDGRGLSEVEARSLEERIHRPDDAETDSVPFGTIRRGIALRNIHLRVLLLHGTAYGVSVSPALPRGSLFSLRVPLGPGSPS
jgi:two-component system sensor histidine kinase YesM